ncbi:hypothetical protein, partial [Bacteroides nordii]|uniref:hypothetical protein n=1 Tax=Bacteroides nordii TaxID=291645 RepID=UPI002A7F568F
MRHSMISLLLVVQTYYIPVKFPRKEREKLKKEKHPGRYRDAFINFEPLVGFEPTTPRLQIT